VFPPPSTRKPPTTQKSPGISSTSGQTSTTNKTGSLPPGTLAHRFSYSAGILFLLEKKKEGGVNRHQSCRKRGVLHRSRDFVRHRPRTNAGVPNWFQSVATTTSFWKGEKSRYRIIGKSPLHHHQPCPPLLCKPLISFVFFFLLFFCPHFSYAACRPTNPSAPNKRWAKK